MDVRTRPSPPVTADVATFVSGSRFAAFPPELVATARRHILDSLGVIAAGAHEPPAQIALRHAQVIGGGDGLAPALVAFVLGVRGHVLDYDDTQLATRPEAV
jgi:2-methylcitrate dehydratase PrpD